jgi:hypothetical protein
MRLTKIQAQAPVERGFHHNQCLALRILRIPPLSILRLCGPLYQSMPGGDTVTLPFSRGGTINVEMHRAPDIQLGPGCQPLSEVHTDEWSKVCRPRFLSSWTQCVCNYIYNRFLLKQRLASSSLIGARGNRDKFVSDGTPSFLLSLSNDHEYVLKPV